MEDIDEARSSYHEIIDIDKYSNRRTSIILENDDRPSIDSVDHKQWGYFRLKQYFAGNHLDPLFQTYIQKTNHGYLSTFLILLCVFSLTHFFIVLGLNMESNEALQKVILDLVVYISVSALSVGIFYISEKYVKEKPKLLNTFSISAFSILFFMNVIVPTYHFAANGVPYRPAYSTFFVLSCYIFFNITSNIKAAILGLSMSAFYIALGVLYHWEYVDKISKSVASDVVYLLCINGFGIYFRLVTEIMKRISLLDRRVLVESTLRLEYEKEQGEQLMASIIPKHAIKKLKQRAEEQIQSTRDEGKFLPRNPWKFDVQQHKDVTILYADIVNYTRMTTTLKSLELVETLNELFGRFDDASEELKVLRVKFLGDCYYCVAGLEPERIPNHAEACVDLGLRMIKIIQDVKRTRLLPIDMRIGIHTGDIYSGVIGDCKWQFDIWSKDVSIANRMETTGQPGKVHITKQTKAQLNKRYTITPSDAGVKDQILSQDNIETYIISPEAEEVQGEILIQNLRQNSAAQENGRIIRPLTNDVFIQNEISVAQSTQRRDSKFIQNRRVSGKPSLMNGHIGRRRTPRDSSRRTAFMDSNIKRYSERLEKTNETIKQSIEDLSLTKYDQYLKTKHINPLTMTFKDCKKEMDFIKQPDHIFKYYIIGIILVLSCIVIIQNINRPDLNRPIGYTLLLVLILILPITWSNCSLDYSDKLPKLKILLKYLQNVSEKIVHSIIFRTVLYFVIWFASTGTVIYEMIACKYFNGTNSNTTNLLRAILYFGRSSNVSSNTSDTCISPWHMTETIALAIIVNFAFLRIHMLLKCVSATAVTILYSILLWRFDDEYFEPPLETYNYGLKPPVSHILQVVFLSFALHCIDRQTDFMTRLDQMLNIEQVEKNKQAEEYQESNKKLINNILPIHVATHYLNVNREAGSLYFEEYSTSKPVAVMFAAIIFQSMESMDETFLKCMNARIVDFDEILMQKYEKQIEKIKIANWTYMAACGLDPGKRDSSYLLESKAKPTKRENIVVIKLLEFAAELLMNSHDSYVQFDLRIGISHGEVTAGVVGSKKPLYDIWGDAVNMASRMESTGVVGRIQVTENTAKIAKRWGIACEHRGKVKVKGKDSEIPTYFVKVDPSGKLVKENSNLNNGIS